MSALAKASNWCSLPMETNSYVQDTCCRFCRTREGVIWPFAGRPIQVLLYGRLPGGLKGDDEETEFPVDVFSHVSRLQELYISSSWVRDSSFWRLFDQPAPNLESFSFIMEMDDKLEDHLTVLPRIFQDDMPKLKNLALGNVSSWPHNRFANLTRLSLENQSPHARPSLPEFLAFLAASPKLQELALVRAGPIPYDYAGVDRPSPAVALPFLKYLEIGIADQWGTKGKHLQLLLKHLELPTTATRCFYEPKPHLSIADHFMQKEDGKWIFEDLKKIVMTCHDTEPKYSCFIGLKDSALYCNYALGTPALGLPSDTMLLKGVEELVYAPAHCWESQNFTTLLGQLPWLRRLKISGLLWAGLDEVLKILQDLDSVDGKGFRYVSRLQELYIYPPEMEKDPQSEEGVNFVMMLGNVRANNGCPLKKIVVHQFLDQSVQWL